MRRDYQQGMILVLVMVLILPLTLMAVSIMQSGREQLKMSSATSQNLIMQTDIESQVVDFLSKKMLRNELILMLKESNTNKLDSATLIQKNYLSSCVRDITVSSSNIIKQCRHLTISLSTSKKMLNSANVIAELPMFLSHSMVDSHEDI